MPCITNVQLPFPPPNRKPLQCGCTDFCCSHCACASGAMQQTVTTGRQWRKLGLLLQARTSVQMSPAHRKGRERHHAGTGNMCFITFESHFLSWSSHHAPEAYRITRSYVGTRLIAGTQRSYVPQLRIDCTETAVCTLFLSTPLNSPVSICRDDTLQLDTSRSC